MDTGPSFPMRMSDTRGTNRDNHAKGQGTPYLRMFVQVSRRVHFNRGPSPRPPRKAPHARRQDHRPLPGLR
jgi:hypothetical protein